MFTCVRLSVQKQKWNKVHLSIPLHGCVSLCEARCESVQIKQFHMKTPLARSPLIAHNSNLIKNRNLNTYTNTQEGTLYPVGFAFVLVCFF